MLTRSSLSVVLMAVVLTFVTLTCCADDWARSSLPRFTDPGPDSVMVDTTGVVHCYCSSSNWHSWGNLTQAWQIETITERDVTCLDMATEEDEIHAAFICSDGNVFYQWRKPNSTWHVELIETFAPASIERVEIEKSPDGDLWLAVLYNDMFYVYEHTDEGWTDHVIETMPAQFKDQSLWRLEIDWENQLHLVRQISVRGFYHIIGRPGNWSNAIINNLEGFPEDIDGYEMTGMEMRKDNTPVLHVIAYVNEPSNQRSYYTGSIINNQGDWEAAVWFPGYYGSTAYDHARDRIHCATQYWVDNAEYWSVSLGDESRSCPQVKGMKYIEGLCCLTIGKLDMPHMIVWNGGTYDYYRIQSDIYCHVNLMQTDAIAQFGYSVSNWKWERRARVGFMMEIAGQYYWAPNWTGSPWFTDEVYDSGMSYDHLITAPIPDGSLGIDVTFYTALLDPVDDVLLNGASWDMMSVSY